MRMRCFLALFPPTETALAIDAWRRRAWPTSGADVPLENLHLTLCFLGNVDNARQQRLISLLDATQDLPIGFEFTLDEPLWQAESSVSWLGINSPPIELQQLAKRLAGTAARAGLRIDRRSFLPHVTLARRVEQPPAQPVSEPSIPFVAERVSLLASTRASSGVRYREIESW